MVFESIFTNNLNGFKSVYSIRFFFGFRLFAEGSVFPIELWDKAILLWVKLGWAIIKCVHVLESWQRWSRWKLLKSCEFGEKTWISDEKLSNVRRNGRKHLNKYRRRIWEALWLSINETVWSAIWKKIFSCNSYNDPKFENDTVIPEISLG